MIVIDGISKTWDGGQTYAVNNLSLEIADGETLVLLGTSGSGKTTTLKMINRLIEPSSGRIFVDGDDVLARDEVLLRRSIGYVFQGIGLFPHMTIARNIEAGLRLLKWPKQKRMQRVAEVLELVSLPTEEFAARLPHELSGGQQQRVGVARALAASPKYLLMDEPFGALDALTRDALQQELISLRKRLGVTIVFVTHDLFEALTLGDRIAVLDDGRLQQVDTAENLVRNPATDFVRQLFQKPAQQLRTYRDLL